MKAKSIPLVMQSELNFSELKLLVPASHHSHCDVVYQLVTITNAGLTVTNSAPTHEIHNC